MTPLNRLLATGLLVALAAVARGQEVPAPRFNSPYSRIGVGDVARNAYAAQLGMGGIGAAFSDPRISSPTNPAALGALRFTSFQVGVELDRTSLESGALESESTDGNLRYLSLSFPLQNSLQRVLDGKSSKWRNGMLFTLAPYSDVGYNVQLNSPLEGLGEVENSFRGSGGYYRLQWGNGFEYERLRGGVNVSYIFGRTNNQQVVLPVDADGDRIGASTYTETDALRARGVELQFGAQYDFVLKETEVQPTHLLTVGASYTLSTQLNGEGSRLATSQNFLGGTFPGFVDTLVFDLDASQRVQLPARYGIGAMYRHVDKFSFGFDVERVQWSDFENSLRPGEVLDDVMRLSAGGEWVPNPKAFGKYWARARYRFGAYSNQSPRPGVNNEVGVSVGLGLPVVRPREETSYVNLSLNAGRFGEEADISQRYVRLVVGFTLTDNSWFYKRRFN